MNEPSPHSEPAAHGEGNQAGQPREERFVFRHVHAITGTLVLAVLGMLIAALFLAGRSQRWFIPNITLGISLPEEGAAGIRQGSEVYFLGTLVGTVFDIRVDAAGRMEAEVHIRRDFFRFVRTDSSAVIKRKFGVVGDAYFEIARGQGRPLPEQHARIVCRQALPSELEAGAEDIRHALVPAIKKFSAGLDLWTRFGTNLIATQARLDRILERVDSLAAGLQQGQGTAGQLMTNPALADDAQAMLAQANEAIMEMRGVLTNLNDVVKNVQHGTARLPEITDAMADRAKDLPRLIEQAQTSMREVERLVEALQRLWLVRKYVNHTNPPPAHPWSASPQPPAKPAQALRSPKDSAR